jgi:poly(3-hydroxyalkanoate) synthetase
LADWGEAGEAEQRLTLADHADQVGEMAEAVLRTESGRAPALVGVGEAGLLASCLAAVAPDTVGALALVQAQLDFGVPASDRPPGWDTALAEVDDILDVVDLLPADLLGPAFEEMGGLAASTPPSADEPSRDRRVRAQVRAALLRDFGRELRRENSPVRGRLQLGRDRVDLSRIECPVATLASEGDPHWPGGSFHALGHLVASEDYTDLRLASGPAGAVELGATLADWLAARL